MAYDPGVSTYVFPSCGICSGLITTLLPDLTEDAIQDLCSKHLEIMYNRYKEFGIVSAYKIEEELIRRVTHKLDGEYWVPDTPDI